MGFEDEIPDTTDAVATANAYAENKRTEAEKARLETLAKMQENQDELRKKQEQLAQLSELLGVSEMRHKMDQQDQSITYLAGRMDEMIKTLNNFVAASQTEAVPTTAAVTTAGVPGMDKLAAIQSIGPVLEQLANAYRIFKGQESQPQQTIGFLTPEYIMDQTAKAVKRKFELGDTIVDSVEAVLTKGLTKQIVKHTLNNAVSEVHEPE